MSSIIEAILNVGIIMQRIPIKYICLILLFLLLSIKQASSASLQQSSQAQNIVIQLIYQQQDANNNTITQTITIYNNNTLNPIFNLPYEFSCSNLNLFTLNQYSVQYYNKTPYSLVISNYSQDILVEIGTYYSSPAATPQNYLCSVTGSHQCTIAISMSCNSTVDYNIVSVALGAVGNYILQFQFNYICYQQQFREYQPLQWGALIIAIFSIFMIFLCSKFQQCRSYSNTAFYINYPFIIVINTISILRFALVGAKINYIQQIIDYVCVIGSFLLGVPAFMVCFAQGVYHLEWKWFRFGCKGRFKGRVMDFWGIGVGVGALCGWYFSNKNWIVSDLIFIVIYIALIKIVKFGSLKIALATFACSLALSIAFIVLSTTITSVYVNINNFNNPLFLTAPILAPIPNHRCSWYFLLSMAYPGMFLAYLERFDKNRSSLIYSPTFVICYGIFSIVWFVVSSLVKPPLPYDLFTVPISMVLLLLFANRRGQLQDLWSGRFFDQQKSYYQNQRQIFANIKNQKTASCINYQNLTSNLRYRQFSQSSRSSQSSKFSQIIKAAREQSTEMRHIYSQGQENDKKKMNFDRDPLSNQTENISRSMMDEANSGKWTLSKQT